MTRIDLTLREKIEIAFDIKRLNNVPTALVGYMFGAPPLLSGIGLTSVGLVSLVQGNVRGAPLAIIGLAFVALGQIFCSRATDMILDYPSVRIRAEIERRRHASRLGIVS